MYWAGPSQASQAEPAGSGEPAVSGGSGEADAADGPMQRALRAAFQSGAPDMRVVAGPEAAQMVQGLLSGDRSQRAAAIETLKQLKASRGMAASGPASQPAPAGPAGPVSAPNPSTFDAISPINTFNSPASTPGPANPGLNSPVGSFSSFSAAGRTDQAERIASLQALRDQGLLSNPDFEAQRQRILDEI